MSPKWIFAVLFLISASSAENITVGDYDTVLSFVNCTTEVRWEIYVEEGGLGVVLIVNETNFNPDNGDHLVFTADETGLGQDQSLYILTGSLTDVWMAIPLVEKAFLTFTTDTCTESTTFTATLRQYEKKAPEPPITTPSPYPPSGLETEIAIHLTGKTVDGYDDPDFISSFQEHIQKAAYEFCDRNLIIYNATKLANETVFLRLPQMCSDKWPDYQSCVQILLAIYVTNPRAPYELSVNHLREFWAEIEEAGLPGSVGVQPYNFPNIALQILWWLGWILIAIVVAAAAGVVLWRVQKRADDMRMRLLDAEEERRKEEIFRDVELRRPAKPLKPTKHQIIPEFMKSNHDSVSKAATAAPTKRLFLKNVFGKKEEPKSPSPSSPSTPVEAAPRFYPNFSESLEEGAELE